MTEARLAVDARATDAGPLVSQASPPGVPRRWQPSPFIRVSMACHGACAVGAVAAPELWPWALGAAGMNHLALTAAGLWPRSTWLGPNLVRLPPEATCLGLVALTIDDGPDPEVTPRVLDLLDRAGAKATFFCIGARARQHPALCREIVTRGHRVENHSDSHSKAFSTFGYARLCADIGAAQSTLADITGQRPRFFRPLGGMRSPLLEPVLARLDLQLASWTRRGFDAVRSDPAAVQRRLVQALAAGDILLLHDGNAARSPTGEPVILAVLPAVVEAICEAGLRTATLAEAVPV